MRPNRWYLAVVTLLLFNGAVNAESEPFPLPSDNRLVVFRYDANQTYTVLAVPGAVTDIAIGDDEELTIAPALGDSVQWRVETAGRHVFVKPIKSDLFTSMTLVTTKRTYQVTLRSSPQGGKWYQRVSWEYPDIIIGQFKQIKHAIEDKRSEDRRLADQIVTERVDYAKLNFDYRIKGDKRFMPTTVFDDGKFTWIKLPADLQDMPALFIVENTALKLINYTQRGDYLVVHRTAPKFVLKLGSAETVITKGNIWWDTDPEELPLLSE